MTVVGGLVGNNDGLIMECYAATTVVGESRVAGLVGTNGGVMMNCYSTTTVVGESTVGGLVGYDGGTILNCYAAGRVEGSGHTGGLIASLGRTDPAIGGFWDIQTSGQDSSAAGIGLTTNEMMSAATFLEAGWDFVGETANGTEDIWWIDKGQDYPHLWWELDEE